MSRRLARAGAPALLAAASVVAALAVAPLAVPAVLAGGPGGAGRSGAGPPGELAIDVPARVEAGEPVVVRLGHLDPAVGVQVIVDGGYGPRRFRIDPTGPVAELEIPPADGPLSGRILVTATQPGRRGAAAFEVVPGAPVDPLPSYLGPRTVVADGEHSTMIVTVPVDAAGNPVPAGTPVEYTVTRPDGDVETIATRTEDLLTSARIRSRTVAGRTRVAARSGGSAGPERSFLEVAGVPAPFGLEVVGEIPPADGRALATFRTGELVDDHGNALPDGVLVHLDLRGVTGNRRLYGTTIDAVAEFAVEAPSRPGLARAVAITSGRAGDELEVEFPPAVAALPASLTSGAGGRALRIGPVRTVAGAFVPDATAAVVTADGFAEELELESGVATVMIPARVLGPVSVTVLGAEVTVR